MKKTILLTTIFVLSLVLAACQPSVDQAKANFCENVGEFAQASVQFRALNATSTKDEASDAVSDLERAWNNLQESAADLTEAQVDGVEDALGDLKNSIQDIPDDATLAESELSVKQASLETMAETLQIFVTTCTYGQSE
jgi:hypothetical protein